MWKAVLTPARRTPGRCNQLLIGRIIGQRFPTASGDPPGLRRHVFLPGRPARRRIVLLVPVGLADKLCYDAFDHGLGGPGPYFLVIRVWYGVRVSDAWTVVTVSRRRSPQQRGTEEKRRR
jgi:hypothetical protein